MSTATAPTSYSPETVPASGCELIRWPSVHPNGRPGEHAAVLSGIVHNLVLARAQEAEPLTPPRVEVALQKVVRHDDTGEYRLVPRPPVAGAPTRAAFRPGSFSSLDVEGAEILAEMLVGGPALYKATDKELWESLLAACEQTGAHGRALRELCDSVAVLVCLRCGLEADPRKIPWE